MPLVRALIAVLVLCSSALANVLVVRTAGAPYTTIQAAVNAAVDGDVILVKQPSSYAGFTITNKALTVVGDGFVVNVTSRVVVQSLAATRTVVLSQLDVHPPQGLVPISALVLTGIDGQVRVEGCTLTGNDGVLDLNCPSGYPYGCGTDGGRGVDIGPGTGGVAFVGCTITGGDGGTIPSGDPAGNNPGGAGGDGARCVGMRASIHDCTLRGGDGGTMSTIGGDAGDGVQLRASGSFLTQLLLSNTSSTGGHGGSASDVFGLQDAGDGGDGLDIGTGTLGMTLDSTLVGGSPGGCFVPCTHHGAPGVPVRANGAHTAFAVSHVALTAPAVVRAGTTMTLQLAADPGDAIYLFESSVTSFIGRASWRGFWLARAPGPVLFQSPPTPIAVLPGLGSASVVVPAPSLAPTAQGRTHFYQAYRVSPSGSLTLGSYAAVTVVQPGL